MDTITAHSTLQRTYTETRRLPTDEPPQHTHKHTHAHTCPTVQNKPCSGDRVTCPCSQRHPGTTCQLTRNKKYCFIFQWISYILVILLYRNKYNTGSFLLFLH
ncbi:hypothetical protein H4Q32_010955 [Labeo rohita]|uniref:EGF-like domain-containing protein n=1 Tax=Labeo rohita TaxID=84645 RepID=A0ABQ8LUG0_LABRO|nr:hypothetical protein H4Q32_010955 [Labeo rohita]